MEIKFTARSESPRRPPRHRRDACSMIAPDALVDFHTAGDRRPGRGGEPERPVGVARLEAVRRRVQVAEPRPVAGEAQRVQVRALVAAPLVRGDEVHRARRVRAREALQRRLRVARRHLRGRRVPIPYTTGTCRMVSRATERRALQPLFFDLVTVCPSWTCRIDLRRHVPQHSRIDLSHGAHDEQVHISMCELEFEQRQREDAASSSDQCVRFERRGFGSTRYRPQALS